MLCAWQTTAPGSVVWGRSLLYEAMFDEGDRKVISTPSADRRCQRWGHACGPHLNPNGPVTQIYKIHSEIRGFSFLKTGGSKTPKFRQFRNDINVFLMYYPLLLDIYLLTVQLGTCESSVCVRIESRIESFQLQTNIIYLLKSVIINEAKEMCRTTLFLIIILKHIKLPAYDHS